MYTLTVMMRVSTSSWNTDDGTSGVTQILSPPVTLRCKILTNLLT